MERKCVASIRRGEPCGAPTEPGYKFCDEHKNRPNAIKEREEKNLTTVIDATEAFPRIEEDKPSTEITRERDAVNKEAGIPLQQQTIFTKTTDALNKMIEFEHMTWDMVTKLSPEDWRYTDKAGAEQLHSFIALNERAKDRVLRGVTAVAKLDIDAQSVNANKMLREMIKICVTNTLTRMGMDQLEIERARQILAEEFEKASGQAS